jgi:uncharacterized damage-inducible protein DinB
MNDGLFDALSHNSWASRELLLMCRDLTDEQLETVVPGVYGSIIATFRHIIRSESGYYRRLTGDEPEWLRIENDAPDIAELIRRNDEMAGRWERFLEQPFDAEHTFQIHWHDDTQRDVPAGVVLAQAIHHGSDHRSQICTMLTVLHGKELPPMGLWDWAEVTGRARVR